LIGIGFVVIRSRSYTGSSAVELARALRGRRRPRCGPARPPGADDVRVDADAAAAELEERPRTSSPAYRSRPVSTTCRAPSSGGAPTTAVTLGSPRAARSALGRC
jgi:hypothetical protein